ncbi:MAG: zf-HC2 domain-containing protein [Lysinibacillus sp.]
MNKLPCDVVRDLLPLYHDEVCSEASRQMVEEHLSTCEDCRNELAAIGRDIQLPAEDIKNNQQDQTALKSMSAFWNKTRKKAFLKGIAIATAVCLLLVGGYYGLFEWNITTVASEDVEISDVSRLADGKIVYHAEITDGYALYRMKYDLDKDGNFYMIPLRPVIKDKAEPPYALEKGHDFIDLDMFKEDGKGPDIKAIYYGSPDDAILVWKEGMELPEASPEVESQFNFD